MVLGLSVSAHRLSRVIGVAEATVLSSTTASRDNIILVGGFSKAYSSLLAFLALPTSIKNLLKIAAPPYLYSGPSPVASLATVLSGFDVNEKRGDEIRQNLHRKTAAVLDCLQHLHVNTSNNRMGFPIIEIPLAEPDRIKEMGDYLFDRGIYVTMAAYPLVPRNDAGFRVQVTAANSDAEIEQLIEVLHEVSERFPLQRASSSRVERRSQSQVLVVV